MQEKRIDSSSRTSESKDEQRDPSFWDDLYASQTTRWDLGMASPAIVKFVDTLENKNLSILIPGCGNAYEAEYLLDQGFMNITLVDISPLLINNLRQKFNNRPGLKIVEKDFFLHEDKYDLILEQTFFCALHPALRIRYMLQMHKLLNDRGILAGLLFNRDFDASPPFGGQQEDYQQLFDQAFDFIEWQACEYSIEPRAGYEYWIKLRKISSIYLNHYRIETRMKDDMLEDLISKWKNINGIVGIYKNLEFKQLIIKTFLPIHQINDSQSIFDEPDILLTKLN